MRVDRNKQGIRSYSDTESTYFVTRIHRFNGNKLEDKDKRERRVKERKETINSVPRKTYI